MDFKAKKELVYTCDTVFDGQCEQGVEFDYILPDYYPDIFKILKCSVCPKIVSYSLTENQLYFDGVVYIKVLYVSENSNNINCVRQRFTYSKTIDLQKSIENGTVHIIPKTDYVNCRAISGRRIDVRGAVSCKIRVNAMKKCEIITDCDGMMLKKGTVDYSGSRISAEKQFVIREDIETGAGKGGIIEVIHYDTNISFSDYKTIADKIVVKGEVKVKALYLVKTEDENTETEVMEANIPISQIIDMEGLTEEHKCIIELSVLDCDLEIKANENGDNRVFGCDITVDCIVTARTDKQLEIISDAYSTEYESDFTTVGICLEKSPRKLSAQLSVKASVEYPDGVIGRIYDCRAEIMNISCVRGEGNTTDLMGQITYQLIGANDTGAPIFMEKSEAFRIETEIPMEENSVIEPYAEVMNCGYSIVGDNRADVRVGIYLGGYAYDTEEIQAINEIKLNTDKVKTNNTDYALKLYFADSGENVWDIAKSYNTDAAAIMRENDLEEDVIRSACMLLLPIV